MSKRGLNSDTTNVYVEKRQQDGFYSRLLISCLSHTHTHTHTHTHSNVCIVSSGYAMIQISTLQFSCIHH